jgi:Gpi18-like mannosyltransferase
MVDATSTVDPSGVVADQVRPGGRVGTHLGRVGNRLGRVRAGLGGRSIRPEALLLVGALVLLAVAIRVAGLGYESRDYVFTLTRWLAFIDSHGGYRALRHNFADYNVPYLYVLVVIHYLPMSELLAIKLVSVAFDVVIGWYCYRIVALRYRPAVGVAAGLMAVLLPTVVANGAVWAQCDVIYSAFCVAALYHLLGREPYIAALLFGFAFALKLQAVFVFPLLLVLVLLRMLPRRAVLLIPVVYGAAAFPAWLLGRSGRDLLTIYVSQAGGYSDLTLNAPSVFAWFSVGRDADLLNRAGVLFAAVVALFLALAIVFAGRPLAPGTIVTTAAMFSVTVPFFLPRMHERYFFLADVLTLLAAFYRPRELWWTPIAVQIASFNSYVPFLFSSEVAPATGLHPHLLAGLVFVVMLALIRAVGRDLRFALLLGGQLLQRPRVAVGVAEEDEGTPRLDVDLAGVDAAADQLFAGGRDVGDDDLDPLLRPRRHLGDAGAEHDRTG